MLVKLLILLLPLLFMTVGASRTRPRRLVTPPQVSSPTPTNTPTPIPTPALLPGLAALGAQVVRKRRAEAAAITEADVTE